MGQQDKPFDHRRAGVLLHVTSLPGGPSATSKAGDLGDEAYRFVDFLADAGCTVWQVLPLVPTHAGDGSPYNSLSAMAGNTELISRSTRPDARARARRRRWTTQQRGRLLDAGASAGRLARAVRRVHRPARAATTAPPGRPGSRPCATATRRASPRRSRRSPTGCRRCASSSGSSTSSGAGLREYAAGRGVLLFGDLPIFVAPDSADVWASRELFELDDDGSADHGVRRARRTTSRPTASGGTTRTTTGTRWPPTASPGGAAGSPASASCSTSSASTTSAAFEAAWHVPVEAPTARDGALGAGSGRATC